MKYDYKCVAVGPLGKGYDEDAKKIEGLINKHASEGWEFMSIYNLGSCAGCFAIFRRQH